MIDPIPVTDPRRSQLEQRLERMERKLDMILGHLGIEYVDQAEIASRNFDTNIDSLLRQGKTIDAIKLYRSRHPDISLLQARMIIQSRFDTMPPVDAPVWEPQRWEPPQDRM